MTAEELWQASGLRGTYQAWPFGGAPDKLAGLVIQGIKTGTCSSLTVMETNKEDIPKPGDYSVILDSKGNAVCIIQTTTAYLCPFYEVSADHAWKEGEGDRSLDYWRRIHEEYFTEELAGIGQEFNEKIILVCEEFRTVYIGK